MDKRPTDVCSRCVLDGDIPEIRFDGTGVCTYCHIHEALENAFPIGEEGKKEFESLFAKIRQNGKGREYDCVVGVSGGTDSTYLVHLLKEGGLRPLAVHFDNGWNTDISVSNIKNVTEILKVDLVTDVVQWAEFRDLLASFLRAGVPWADLPTDLGLTASLYKAASVHGIKDIMVGNNFRTEGKVPTPWNYGDSRMIHKVHQEFGTTKISRVPVLGLFEVLFYAGLKRIRLHRPMYYINFNKDDAKRKLEELYSWRDYGGHHHESIFTRFVLGDWLPNRFGIDKRKITFSALVRSGQLSRENAFAALREPPQSIEQIKRDREYVLKKLCIARDEFDRLISGPVKSHYDFPSYLPLIKHSMGLVQSAVKLLLPWKPTMFFEHEVKKRIG